MTERNPNPTRYVDPATGTPTTIPPLRTGVGGPVVPVGSRPDLTPPLKELYVGTTIIDAAAPAVLNKSKNTKSSTTVAGNGSVMPLIYGQRQVGGKIAGIQAQGPYIYFLVVWCWGTLAGVQSISKVEVSNTAIDPSWPITNYLGNQTIPDPTIKQIRNSKGKPYNDILPGVCYSVVGVPPKTGIPTFTAVIDGMLVYTSDPGQSPTPAAAYSTCPAYIVADFITNSDYGMGSLVNWTDVQNVASWNNSMVGTSYPLAKLHCVANVVYAEFVGGINPGVLNNDIVTISGATGQGRNFYNGTFKVTLDVGSPLGFHYTGHGGGGFGAVIGGIEMMFTEQRHQLNIAIDTVQPKATWLSVLCNYAGCFPFKEGNVWRLVPDMPVAPSPIVSYGPADLVYGTLKLTKKDLPNLPSVVQVRYSDPTQDPWADVDVTAYAPGVLDGTVNRRVSQIQVPGITRASEAYRYAVQRLNDALTSDLTCTFTIFDEGLLLEIGDVFSLSHPIGLTNKLFRCMQLDPSVPGRWAVSGTEYDPAKYSNIVVVGPTTPDSILPSPFDIPDITGLNVTEDIYQVQTGRYASRLNITWDGPTTSDYALLAGFDVQIMSQPPDSEVISQQTFQVPQDQLSFISGPQPEGYNYTIQVRARSALSQGNWDVFTLTSTGKTAPPSDVLSITGHAINGQLFVSWVPPGDLDLSGYELRYGGGGWDTGTFMAFVATPATNYSTFAVPSGTQTIMIKACDSVRTPDLPFGDESVNAVSVTIDIPPNANASYVTYDCDPPTLTNMIAFQLGWITDMGDVWDTLFPSLTAMNTYTEPLAEYHTPAASGLVSATVDIGAVASNAAILSGIQFTTINGAPQVYIEYKIAMSEAWTRVYGTTATATFRFVRVGVTSSVSASPTGYDTFYVTELGEISVGVISNGNYVVAMKLQTAPTASQVLIYHPFPGGGTFTLPAGCAGSVCKALVAATSQTDFDLQKNGVSIGTIRFAASGTTATYVGVTLTTFDGGTDDLRIIAPSSPDATLANLGFSILMTAN